MRGTRWSLRTLSLIITVMLATLLAGCSGASPGNDTQAGAPMPEQDRGDFPADEAGGQEGGDGDDEQMVIRTRTLRLEVESTATAVGDVRDLVRAHEGRVTTMQIATDDGWLYRYDEQDYDGTALRGWITVRVPTDGYEEFVANVVEMGTLKYQAESTEDVTQQYIDLSARLENLRAQEARLREFFEAAQDVGEMLAIEEELGRIRGEIESLDAQVTYLERQAAMATVTIELTEPSDIVRPDGDSWGFLDAITEGFRAAAGVVTWLLMAVIATSPLWILGLIVFFPIRATLRRRRAREKRAAEPVRTPEPEDVETLDPESTETRP